MEKKKTKPSLIMEKLKILVWIDLCNGLSRYDIMQKLEQDQYDDIKSSELCRASRYNILQYAYDMAKEELEEQRDKQRELFYSRILTVYNESMVNNDRQAALKALDMFAKFGGLYTDKQKVELSGNLTNEVTISFGFDNQKN